MGAAVTHDRDVYLAVSVDDRCVFVSQDPAKDLRALVEKAGIANDLEGFAQALSKDQKDKFDQLIEAWDEDKATAYVWLKRCELKTLPETELDGVITSHSDLCFFSSGSSAFAELRHYAEDRFNKLLTTELVRAEIREGKAGALVLKDWALDPTLREGLCSETDAYLHTYSPFGAGGSAIPRYQVCEIAQQIGQPNGPNVILITGIAGSGKSGVVRGLIDKLRELEVTHVAFRVDHHPDRGTPQEIGRALTGRAESPVATLKGLEPERPSVLVIDQVDAVSEVSGRSGAMKEAVLRMINDARHFKTVLVILVCRSFDFNSDSRLKALKEANRVEHIDVPLLEWDSDVAPFFAGKGIDATQLSPSQKELLRFLLHLAVFLEVGSEERGFASRNDLFESLIRCDDEHKALSPLVRYALLSSVGWFDRLRGSGWLRAALNGTSDERRQAVFRWLSSIAGERPEEVADLLNTWWNRDPVRGKRLLDWFGFARWQKPVPALVALCEKVIRSRPPGFFEERGQPRREIFLLYTTWAEKKPNEGAVILRALFDAWFDAHPGQRPFERDELHDLGMSALGRMAEKAPRAFIAGTIDALSRSIDETNRREASGERDYSFRRRTFSGHRFGADKFLGFFRSALRQIASTEPDAARAAFPYLSRDDRHRVENAICSSQPEIDLAIRGTHEIKEGGETDPWWSRDRVIWWLNRSGFEPWCVLETIGEGLLTSTGVQHLKQLRRKFSGEKVPDPNHMGIQAGGSPMHPERAAHMNDAHWLRAMELKRPLHSELQHATKENPARFVALMKRLPDTADPSYVSYVLRGLAEAEEVEDELLKEAIRNAHGRPGRPYGTDIIRIFGKRPQIAKEPSIFDVLAWYVEHGEANEDETIDASNTAREIVSIEDLMDRGGKLHVRGINGPRGLAAEALGAVLWQVPEIADRAWQMLARRIEHEPLISVRCCLIRPLVPLFNNDRQRCAQFVERLVEGPSAISLSPLITQQGTYLLPYLLSWVPDVGHRLLDSLLNSGDETMRLIGAWHVMRHSFQEPAYASEADRLIEEGNVYRRLAADIASHAITSEEFRDRAERQLIRFFNDEDKQVRQQAADVFRQLEPNEFARFSDLAAAYLASRAFDHDAFAFFHALEQATSSVHVLVISAAQKIIANLEANNATGTSNYVDLHQLQGLLTREYAASENDPELRRRLLDVIDTMLEKEMYGADEILKAHERE